MDNNLIPLSKILCLIPMKGIQDAKKRLRISFPSDKQVVISNIITKLFVNTISTVKEFVDFAVVSPSEDILEVALDYGSSFIYQDLGIDLNNALITSINYAIITERWQYVLILTADLPLLSVESFPILRKNLFSDTITILSAPSKNSNRGTSGLLLPLELWKFLTLQFGVNSFDRFIEQFTEKNFPFHIVHNELGFDLDTIDDLTELRLTANSIINNFINEGELNQLFSL